MFAFLLFEWTTNSKIMETSADTNDLTSKLLTKVLTFIVDNSATFDTASRMLYTNLYSDNIFIKSNSCKNR